MLTSGALALRLRMLAQGRAVSAVLLGLYQVLGTLAFVVTIPYGILRAARHPGEMRERMGWGRWNGEEAPLWLHAASLGELEAVRSLLREGGREFAPPILLSVLSVSARRRAPERVPGVPITFAPLDLWFTLLPFLRKVRPRGLVLTETELWPMTLLACRMCRVPVVLISGRLSSRHWKRTRLLRFLLTPLLGSIEGISAQSGLDEARFRAMGASGVQVLGNVKYRMDAGESARESEELRRSVLALLLRSSLLQNGARAPALLLVAGSVRLGEECVLQVAGVPGVLLVLAPRHLRERAHWIETCGRRGLRVAPWSESASSSPSAGAPAYPVVLLLDTHGELGAFYRIADAAFVGGTLAPIGGHNLFEPAREGIPIAFGPYTGGVSDVAEPLLRRGGGFRVKDGAEVAAWAARMAADRGAREVAGRAARAAALEVAGASARNWDFLESFPWTRVRRVAGARENAPPERESRSSSVAARDTHAAGGAEG
jgi:3-deoxy-D-manno-octulosonic-acid transferase